MHMASIAYCDAKKIIFLRTKDLVAAVSNCRKSEMTGFVSMPEDTFEFSPLTSRLKDKVKGQMLEFFRTPLESQGLSMDDFFLVKRVTFPNFTGSDTKELQWDDADSEENIDKEDEFEFDFIDVDYPIEVLEVGGEQKNMMVETAIFFDHVAYKRFSAVYDDDEIMDYLLAYVNQVAAIYKMPSLGQEIDIMITYLEIQKTAKFDNMEGDRVPMLDSFCSYSNEKNPEDDLKNPRHWDVAILVSGLDIWVETNGKRVDDTLGLTRTGGMGHSDYSCVVVEFGVVGALGNSYTTTGFSAAYTLAHELGHSLGMKHDSFSCQTGSQSGTIMSSTRSGGGQTVWSPCSGEKVRDNKRLVCLADRPHLLSQSQWDHSKTQQVPGYFYTAQEQCRFFFRGKEGADISNPVDDPLLCENLICKQGDQRVNTGPPLEGTACGGEGTQWCRSGECVEVQGSHWSHWRSGPCRSACTKRGTGARELFRTCLTLPGFPETDCGDGPDFDVALCGDTDLCGSPTAYGGRRTRAQLATLLCEQQAAFIDSKEIEDFQASPAPHSAKEPWQACALYCKRADGKG